MTTMLICIVYCISNMYIVAIFALALLSPLPFAHHYMYGSIELGSNRTIASLSCIFALAL